MKQEMMEAGLTEPVFRVEGGFFTIELKRPIIDDPINGGINSDDPINGGINGGINSDDPINGGINGGINSDDPINGGINLDDTTNDTINYGKIILKVIQKQGGLAAPQISKIIGKSMRTTERYISMLKMAGKIEFRGALKTGGYYVTTENISNEK